MTDDASPNPEVDALRAELAAAKENARLLGEMYDRLDKQFTKAVQALSKTAEGAVLLAEERLKLRSRIAELEAAKNG